MLDTMTQYRAVREDIGLLDRSEVGTLAITGKDRFSWLQGMVSNDVRLLEKGQRSLQACVLDATGHLLSELTLINAVDNSSFASTLGLSESDFILAVLPRINLEKIAAIFDRFLIMEEVEIMDVSERLACFSLQGPRAAQIGYQDAPKDHILVASDHTGSGGVDLYFPMMYRTGRREEWLTGGSVEIGEEAQEILRVEAGLPKYGVDMDESILAPEALPGTTHLSLTKGCYVGQEIVARIDSRGHTNRALTGFVVIGDMLPVPGDRLTPLPMEEPTPRETGRITSVISSSPAADGKPIALGYARHEHRTPGTLLRVGSEDGVQVEVVALPFYSK